MADSLKNSITGINMEATGLISTLDGSTDLKNVISRWVKGDFGATVSNPNTNINISEDAGTGGQGKIKVKFSGDGLTGTNEGTSNQPVANSSGNKDVLVTITLSNRGRLQQNGNSKEASAIANKIAGIVALAALTSKLKSTINTKEKLTTSNLAGGNGLGNSNVQNAIRDYVKVRYEGATVSDPVSSNITAREDTSIPNMLKVELTGSPISPGTGSIGLDFYNNDEGKGVKVTINISSAGSLKTSGVGKDNHAEATEIARRLAKAALIEKLKNPGQINGTDSINDAETLKSAIENNNEVKKAIAAVVKAFYNAEVADKTDGKKDISASQTSTDPVIVTIGGTSGSKQFSELVEKLKKDTNITGMGSVSTHSDVADKIKLALNAGEVKPKLLDLIKSMVGDTNRGKVTSVTVEVAGSSAQIQVKINGKTGSLGNANVSVTTKSSNSGSIEIQVQGDETNAFTGNEGSAIAKALALAVGHSDVVEAAKKGSSGSITEMSASSVDKTIDGDQVIVKTSPDVKLQVKLHRSLVPGKADTSKEKEVADNIANKIKNAVELTNDHCDIEYIKLVYY